MFQFDGNIGLTEVQLLYILILRQTCLVVLVAKYPILYIALLFFIYRFKQLLMFA